MAQTNFTPISLYYSTTTGAVPTAGNLVAGELALNITDGILFYKDNLNVVKTIGGIPGGATTQVQYNNAGTFAGDADFTFTAATNRLTVNAIDIWSGLTPGAAGNTAVGTATLAANTGVNNTAIGFNALTSNISGISNTATGSLALNQNTTGIQNTATGRRALELNTVGDFNTAVGVSALLNNTTGDNNTATGLASLSTNTTGANNTAFGVQALTQNTVASNNTAVGYQAGYTNTTGPSGTFVGYRAGFNATTGNANTIVGSDSGFNLTTGADNTFIGQAAAAVVNLTTTGNANTYVGSASRGSSGTNNREIVIGFNITGQGTNTVSIGSDAGKVHNSFTVNATWTQASDQRLKKNIQDDNLGLSFINRLNPVKYEWKASNELDKDNPYYAEENNRTTGVVMHGLIAQEVKSALDAEGVNTFAGWSEGEDGIQGISREMFITPLIKAIQELNAKLEAQALEIAQLKGN